MKETATPPTTTLVHLGVDETIKAQVTETLAAMGLSCLTPCACF
jgi:antitoxin component of RelBE/YafQ-DinJ toxin-antitoxin module